MKSVVFFNEEQQYKQHRKLESIAINPFKLKALSRTLLIASLCSVTAVANVHAQTETEQFASIEVITIHSQRNKNLSVNKSIAQGKTSAPDLAQWLSSVPGANLNSNGPISGIAQYRGLYGDRVNVSLDGHPVIGAGPNAMDTPLSYSTPLIVDSMVVFRGVAPVSAGIDTLGGAVEVKMRKAENIDGVSGDIQAGYRSNNSANTLSGVTNFSQNNIAVLVYGNSQKGDSMESGDGVAILPTDFDKVQLGGDFRYLKGSNELGLSYHYTDTGASGTPALPMDIEFIESQRITLDGAFDLSHWNGTWKLGYIDADHAMTNFLMRQNLNMDKYRRNNADAQTTDFKLMLDRVFTFGKLTLGTDGYFATHNSLISNPNNPMFLVHNFNGVEDNRFGVFTELRNNFLIAGLATDVELGIRLKHTSSNAGEVASSMSGMMNMMGNLVGKLEGDFNKADREVTETNVDIALSSQVQLSEQVSLYSGIGLKNRAPSYQERYLWMPMEATGGLADGHTYIGNINLDVETAYQLDLGLTYQNDSAMISPQIFYKRVDNYIQGTPLTMENKEAKMLAQMMAGDSGPLKFSNVEAKLYGVDINAHYYLTSNLQLSGVMSYVQGERTDIDDYLYRISPLNGNVRLKYSQEDWSISTTMVSASKQNKVSITNTEKTSSGYGIVHLEGEYYIGKATALRLGIDNLFDKSYKNHLGGYNRVKGTDIPVMDRLPSEGLSAWVEITYSL
ncbi:MAG: TonB-dependent receptor [Colwellia sp.]